jgi:2-hydroxychromene-2-carboxylate isomerase
VLKARAEGCSVLTSREAACRATEGSADMQVEFYYDLVSPYSYLAYGQIGRICRENGAELVLCPMLLGAVHREAGIKAPIETKLKARYQARDIRRWAEYYGLSLRFPDPFPFRTLKTMRAAMFLRERGELEAFTDAAFALYWQEDGAPRGLEEADEDAPISSVAERMGANPENVLEGAASANAKQDLKVATSEAVERGVFGAPAFFVGEEMFWGNDRLHFVEAALQQ